MYAAENLINKYGRLLQMALPAAVAVDTLRSCYVVSQLARNRMRVRCIQILGNLIAPCCWRVRPLPATPHSPLSLP